MFMEVIKRSDELPREVQIGLKRRRTEILVEVFESARDVLHEDAGFFLKMVVF